ncbi:MAG TPA: heavy-metal-associated domain-containing protein [Allosphingosinicella sp.]|nr:heavy-metal-associated domain-containing protein [Allosphingosinicella sp.]
MLQLTVRGMSCGPCTRAVTNAVHSVDPGAKVEIDLEAKLVDIESGADAAAIAAAIEDAGYKVEREPA